MESPRPPSPEQIRSGLRKLRWTRHLSHGPMMAFAFLVLVELAAPQPLSDTAKRTANLVLPFALAGFALSFWLRTRPCPRCRLPFFQARRTFAGGRRLPVWNDFTGKCLNCGLPISGEKHWRRAENFEGKDPP